jgi:hypothetical protein
MAETATEMRVVPLKDVLLSSTQDADSAVPAEQLRDYMDRITYARFRVRQALLLVLFGPFNILIFAKHIASGTASVLGGALVAFVVLGFPLFFWLGANRARRLPIKDRIKQTARSDVYIVIMIDSLVRTPAS